jgi:hypothetical protein
MGVVSTPCALGLLELDEELDELEPVGCCARIEGAITSPPTSNPTTTARIGRWFGMKERQRDREERFRLATIRFRRSLQV